MVLSDLLGVLQCDQFEHCPFQDLVEKVVILRQAVERTHGAQASAVGAMLAQKMGQYASLLASQGSLDTALAYLPENSNQVSSLPHPPTNQPTSPCSVLVGICYIYAGCDSCVLAVVWAKLNAWCL